MGFGMVGALLAELALSGRIDLESKKVRVVDPSPTGEPRTDDLLSRLVTDTPRKPQAWAQKLQNAFTKEVLTDLCTAELVRREESRFLGLMWDTSRYPQLGGAHRDRLLTDLRGSWSAGSRPPPRASSPSARSSWRWTCIPGVPGRAQARTALAPAGTRPGGLGQRGRAPRDRGRRRRRRRGGAGAGRTPGAEPRAIGAGRRALATEWSPPSGRRLVDGPATPTPWATWVRPPRRPG